MELKKKIRRGQSREKLIEYLMSDTNVASHAYSRPVALDIIHKAYEDVAQQEELVKSKIRPIQLARCEEVLEEALKANDRNNALKAIDIINKLYSLYIEKQEVALSGDIIHFNFGGQVTNTEQNDNKEE